MKSRMTVSTALLLTLVVAGLPALAQTPSTQAPDTTRSQPTHTHTHTQDKGTAPALPTAKTSTATPKAPPAQPRHDHTRDAK